MDLTLGLIASAYLSVALTRARVLLRQRMTETICTYCDTARCNGHHVAPHGKLYVRMPRGQWRERRPRDVLRCVWFGLWWPFWLATWTFLRIRDGLRWSLMFASRLLAPATDAERARAFGEATERVERSAKQLEQITAELNEPAGKPSPRPRRQARHAVAGAEQADAMEAGEILRALHLGAPLTNDQLAAAMAVLMRLLHSRLISVTDVRRLAGLPDPTTVPEEKT